MHHIVQDIIQANPQMGLELMGKTTLEDVRKGKRLLDIGDVCRKMYIVEQGLLRFYYIEKGKDITHWFIFEGNFITEADSFFQQTPSDYAIETLEDSLVRSISYEDLEYMFQKYPEFERTGRLLATEMALQLGEKLKDLQFRTASERYEKLLSEHPGILQRVPLGHIASYLGITQQSLSRIRAQNSSE